MEPSVERSELRNQSTIPLLEQDRGFILPVDSELKATVFPWWTVRGIHICAFHGSMIATFISYTSTYAPAAASITIRDAIDLEDQDVMNANIVTVVGCLVSRVILGSVCNSFGPRITSVLLLLISSLGVFGIAVVQAPLGSLSSSYLCLCSLISVGYVLCRLIIGFSTGTYILCQYWCSVMFNVRIVGQVNAVAAGIGSSGGGITQVLMPLLINLFSTLSSPFLAWRLAFFVLGITHLVTSLFLLTSTQDYPDSNMIDVHRNCDNENVVTKRLWYVTLANYRVWLCALFFSISASIEVALLNIGMPYFVDNFSVSTSISGLLNCLFGSLSIVVCPMSGKLSDLLSSSFGMCGRLWLLFLLLILTGLSLMLLAVFHHSLPLTSIALILCAIGSEGSQSATFAIVPFVSRRALGIVSGIVGASPFLTTLFLLSSFYNPTYFDMKDGFFWNGALFLLGSLCVLFFHFPMWGGILSKSSLGKSEKNYYLAEYSEDEIAAGLADKSLRFAFEATSQRGHS